LVFLLLRPFIFAGRFSIMRGVYQIWTDSATAGLMLRHNNGLVFGSKLYRGTAKDCGLQQEFITPYTPEENGLSNSFSVNSLFV